MKLLVIGVEGLLGAEIFQTFSREDDFEVFSFNHEEFDITDFDRVRDTMPAVDVVVNCAGERDVDEAESLRSFMFDVNMKGARNLAMVCKRKRIKLIHFSSHHVFDGQKIKGYTERDVARPLNIYGSSKLAGDKEIRATGCDYLIIRTQTLYGEHGHCVVNDLIEKCRNPQEHILVADDEIIVPTWTRDVARSVVKLIRLGKSGLVNISAKGQCSSLELAQFIRTETKSQADIQGVPISALCRVAKHPKFGVLDHHWYTTWVGEEMPEWKVSLKSYLDSKAK